MNILNPVLQQLDDLKAVNPVTIPLKDKSDIADYMVVASGTSKTHVNAIAQKVYEALKKLEYPPLGMAGLENGDWVVIDGGDVVVHLFRPEVRDFYDIESLWEGSVG